MGIQTDVILNFDDEGVYKVEIRITVNRFEIVET